MDSIGKAEGPLEEETEKVNIGRREGHSGLDTAAVDQTLRGISFRLKVNPDSKTPGVPYEFCVIGVDERHM